MIRYIAIAALFVCLTTNAAAQSIYGSLSGKVLDGSGAPIPKAKVFVIRLDTGFSRETATDLSGFWRTPSLPNGSYSVEVSAVSFQPVVRRPLRVETAVERAIETVLRPATVAESITVTEEEPLIQATRSQLSEGVETRRILALPGLSSRDALALLQPGVANNNNGRPGSALVVNGARPRSNNFTIDGANNNDPLEATPRQDLPPESMGEFRILTSAFSAEYGRNAGSVVIQSTKPGTNEFHGALRWNWSGNGFNALSSGEQRTFTGQSAASTPANVALRRARGVTVQNDYLISAGGPVIRNRLFFFASYDGSRFRTSAAPTTTALSPEAVLTLDQNAAAFAPGVVDFLKHTYPTANDPTPRGSQAVRLPDGRTLTLPVQQFNRAIDEGAISQARNFHRGLGRIDWTASDADSISIRYLANADADPYGMGGVPALAVNRIGREQSQHTLTANHTHIFSPSLLNENRISWARFKENFPEDLPAVFNVTGLPAIGNIVYPQNRADNLIEATSNWTKAAGPHTLRFGVNYLYYLMDTFYAPGTRGRVQYPSLSDLLFDRNATYDRYNGDGQIPARTHEVQGFFGDDWRVTQSLTLNLGVRYEFTSVPLGFFSNARPDINNFAPRSGFAWNPVPRLVFRGGYGISYDQIFQQQLRNLGRNFPRGVLQTFADLSGRQLWKPERRPEVPSPDQFTAQGGDARQLPTRLFSPNERIRQPYGQQFSLGVERQFGADYVAKAFYVGSRGLKLIREYEANFGFFQSAVNANPTLLRPIVEQNRMQPVTVSGQAGLRIDPSRDSVLIGGPNAQSTFHSLQLTLEKRFSLGFLVEGNYVWSSFINDSDDILGNQPNRTVPSVPFNAQLDRGRSGFDQPHRFVMNFLYLSSYPNLPGLWKRAFAGWQVSGVTTMATGTPYSVLNANNALGILPAQVPTVAASQRASFNPSGTPNQGTAAGLSSPMFIANPANSGILGNLGAHTQRVGNTYNLDAALQRELRLTESVALQMRWDVFNVLNHRNFNLIPANTVNLNTNNALFLNLGQTNVPGRTMQFLVRFVF